MIKSHIVLANGKKVYHLLKAYENPLSFGIMILPPPDGEAELSKKELKETEQLILKRLAKTLAQMLEKEKNLPNDWKGLILKFLSLFPPNKE